MNRSIIQAAIVAAFTTVLFAPAYAHDDAQHKMEMATAPTTLGDLEMADGFARATLPNAPVGGGYLTITNKGAEDDTLISATSDIAGDAQLHNMRIENDVMKMHEMQDGIPIPAGETVTLAPGGLHIMFMQLKQQLVEGSTVKVTLTFEKSGSTEMNLDVLTIAAKHNMQHSNDTTKDNMNMDGKTHGN